jgi:hypothetical protein|tara:strand:- start:2704 stop:2982 length:279 start_codon:yes stop_codon:yes gene_type:complete
MLNSKELETINNLVAKMGLDDIKMVNERMSLQRTFLGNAVKRTLKIGDVVSFVGRGGREVSGTVSKVKIKNVVVDTGVTRWNVPASMLTKVA